MRSSGNICNLCHKKFLKVYVNLQTDARYTHQFGGLFYDKGKDSPQVIKGFNRPLREITKSRMVFHRMMFSKKCCICLCQISRKNSPQNWGTYPFAAETLFEERLFVLWPAANLGRPANHIPNCNIIQKGQNQISSAQNN